MTMPIFNLPAHDEIKAEIRDVIRNGKFAFMAPRERIDMAKVTLPISILEFGGTIEDMYKELRRRYAPENGEYTISFDDEGDEIEPFFDADFYLRMRKKMEDGTYITIPDGLTREERRKYLMDKAMEIMNKKES